MAIAIQDVQTNTADASTSVTITKPTGLVVDDLLVAVIGTHDSGTINTPSGWLLKESFNIGSLDSHYGAVFTKIADSGDVAASDFTFTCNTSADGIGGALYRIDGYDQDNIAVENINAESSESGGTLSVSGTIDIVITDELLIMFCFALGSEIDFSNHAIAGGTNPTWIKRLEYDNPTALNAHYEILDAIYESTTDITGASITLDTGYNTGDIVVLSFPYNQNASGTAGLLASSPTFPTPTSGGGTSGTVALLSGTPTIQIPTSTVPDKTIANTDKNDATNIVNTNKNNA